MRRSLSEGPNMECLGAGSLDFREKIKSHNEVIVVLVSVRFFRNYTVKPN